MNQTQPAATAIDTGSVLIPQAADQPEGRRLAGAFSALVSLVLLGMVAHQFRHLSFAEVKAMIPSHPAFWAVFAAYYFVAPVNEWLVYRHLWHLPFAGMGAVLRKLVSNELLLGYLGEVQFYAWARSRLQMETAPFGAIKDVTILSALTGNIATLVMLIIAWPLVSAGGVGLEMRSVFISLSVVLVTSFAMLLFRRQLFTLPRRELTYIAAMHFVRIGALLGLAALMWHWVLPQVPVMLWLVLATLRMLVSRLPLVPNKDVVFAGLSVYLLGRETDVAGMLTMMAGLILAAHMVVGTVFGLSGLVDQWRRT